MIKLLLGVAAIVAVPTAVAGGYFLPHPPSTGDPYELPPPSIVEWTEPNGDMEGDPACRPLPRRVLPREPHGVISVSNS